MSEHELDADQLEQLLRDERALRIRAETRAAEQTQKTQIWRTRAEERAERIQRLTTDKKRSKRRKTTTDTSTKPAPPPTERAPTSPATRPGRLASVRAAIALQPDNRLAVQAFATDDIGSTRGTLAESDLVIVDTGSLDAMPTDRRAHFDDWLQSPARQPLVLLAAGAQDRSVLRVANVVFATTPADRDALKGSGVDVVALPPVFDPEQSNPIGRIWQTASSVSREAKEGVPVLVTEDALIGIEAAPPSFPPPWMVTAAAQGTPLAGEPIDPGDPAGLAKAGNSARRWAYRNHTPTVRAAQIAIAAGISVPEPRPTAAAILVSMRLEQAMGALEMIRTQTYRPLSAVIGIHGAQPTAALCQLVDEMADEIPTLLLAFPADLTLGECLNRAIATTGAEILVKIDDDDFYGPSHIEDGIHALEYSAADIVGKGAQFTYIEDHDTTVLRRPREEETFIGGSPTGATMLIRRSTWERVGFPHRPRQVDVLLTRAARYNGATVYANSRWEFCYVRQAAGHTWTTSSSTFLAGASPQWQGFHPARMVVPSLPDMVLH
jgi:hypothetical protein